MTILSSAAPHGAYQYQGEDNWIAIVCFDDLQWNALCEESGIINDPMFASLAKRVNSNVICKRLHGYITKRRIPASVCQTVADRYDTDS